MEELIKKLDDAIKMIEELIIQQITDTLSVCFYMVDGYKTHSENIAFEHAFFVIDEFLEELEDCNVKPSKYCSFVDLGSEIQKNEIIGMKPEKAFVYFKTHLENLRQIRSNILETGQTIWKNSLKIILHYLLQLII